MEDQKKFSFKQNYINFLHHNKTAFIPNSFTGNKIYGFGAVNGPSLEKGDQFGHPTDGYSAN